jgi:hypothetical protein
MSSIDEILVVDDEPDNVAALLEYLTQCRIRHVSVSALSDAATVIAEKEAKGEVFGAVILDNHFCEGDLEEYAPAFDGIEFANILVGNAANLDSGHRRFTRDYFGAGYPNVCSHYRDKVIMFSGSAGLDQEHHPEMFDHIAVAQKYPDRKGSYCEEEVVRMLETMGYTFSRSRKHISKYKRDHGLQAGVTTQGEEWWHEVAEGKSSKHEKEVAAFLRARGVAEDEVREYCPTTQEK